MPLPNVIEGDLTHIIDHNALHDWTQDDEAIRYVSTKSRASDSKDGRTPFQPKATLQSAYDSLPASGGGLVLGNGGHDVGSTGLKLTRDKPVGLYATKWRRHHQDSVGWPAGQGAVIFSGSGSPAQLISFDQTTDFHNVRGFVAEGVSFDVKTGMEYAIFGQSVNWGRIIDCNFMLADADAYAIGLDQSLYGDDASWWRVTDNGTFNGGLFKTLGLQHNQHRIVGNVCFGGTVPYVHLLSNNRSYVRDNNFEVDNTGPFMLIEDSYGCQTSGNAGECTTAGNVFCRVDNSSACRLEDIGTSTPTATDKLYDFTNGSRDNFMIVSTLSFQADLYQAAGSVVFADSDPQKRNYRIASGTGGLDGLWLPNIKRGAGSPEGVVYGMRGDWYQRTDGGTTTSLYVKTADDGANTGWTAK